MNRPSMLRRIRPRLRGAGPVLAIVPVLLLALGAPRIASAAADNSDAAIQDLRNRIDALQAQIYAQQKGAPPPANAPAASAAAPVTTAPPTVATPAAGGAPSANLGPVKVSWGGYVKLDVLGSRFSDGAVAQSTGRDFYVPNAIPTAAPAAENGRSYLDFSAKETRLFLKADANVLEHKVGAYVEFDFISGQIAQSTGGAGNESITNAYNPSLRRAYITFDNLLVGQDWSTFQNLSAFPEALDFVTAPTEGTVFIRQPQIRYTAGPLQFSLENPETTVGINRAAATPSAAFANTDDNTVPDGVARYNLKSGIGDFALSGIVRQLTDRGTVGGANDTTLGYGASFSGKIPTFGGDDLRFQFNGGRGIGRYLAINSVGDAVVSPGGKLKTIVEYDGYLAYRHLWSEKWRSSLIVSGLFANTGKTTASQFNAGVTHRSRSAAVNLLYSPITNLTFGGEFRYARRDTVGDLSGDLKRIQFSAKYAF